MEPYRQLVFTYIGYESKEVMVKEQRYNKRCCYERKRDKSSR